MLKRIEFLTGWARVRLRRHPRIKTAFSMVSMRTPMEKEKTPSDFRIFKTSESPPTQKKYSEIQTPTFRSRRVAVVERGCRLLQLMPSSSFIQQRRVLLGYCSRSSSATLDGEEISGDPSESHLGEKQALIHSVF